MKDELAAVEIGLGMTMLTLLFGICLGIYFGVNEDGIKDTIAAGVAAHPTVHDEESADKIWRYAQRAHFHATGIAAFSLGLLLFTGFSSLRRRLKTVAGALIGLGGFYPLSWFTMYFLAPTIGRGPAHDHGLTLLFVLVGVVGLLAGITILCLNRFFGMLAEES